MEKKFPTIFSLLNQNKPYMDVPSEISSEAPTDRVEDPMETAEVHSLALDVIPEAPAPTDHVEDYVKECDIVRCMCQCHARISGLKQGEDVLFAESVRNFFNGISDLCLREQLLKRLRELIDNVKAVVNVSVALSGRPAVPGSTATTGIRYYAGKKAFPKKKTGLKMTIKKKKAPKEAEENKVETGEEGNDEQKEEPEAEQKDEEPEPERKEEPKPEGKRDDDDEEQTVPTIDL